MLLVHPPVRALLLPADAANSGFVTTFPAAVEAASSLRVIVTPIFCKCSRADRRTSSALSCPRIFVCEISCAGGVGVNGHIESPDQCLARGSGKAHVRVKTHKQDTLGAYGTQPLLQACPVNAP